MPNELSKYIHDFIRPKMIPSHYNAFVEGTSPVDDFLKFKGIEYDDDTVCWTFGRGAKEYHLWANLQDTPYTRGETLLANWGSIDDVDRARMKQ